MKKILFISHEASLTGAPLALLELITAVSKRGGYSIKILIRTGGALEGRFSAIAPAYVYYRQVVKKTLKEKILFNLRRNDRRTAIENLLFREWRPDLVYSNTVANEELTAIAHRCKIPVIVHVRELTRAIKDICGDSPEILTSVPAHYIAISKPVQKCLAGDFGIPVGKISLIDDFIDTENVVRQAGEKDAARVKRELNIPSDAFIVGGSGIICLRKGVDHFVSVAGEVIKALPGKTVYFVWAGGPTDGEFFEKITKELLGTPAANRIIFTGITENPFPLYNIFDIFLMTSREEPFGRVVLENGLLKKPMIAFAGSGFPEEFMGGDCGIVVEKANVRQMADKVIELIFSEKTRTKLGDRASEKTLSGFSATEGISKILAVIDRFAA